MHFFVFVFVLIIYLFLAALGLRCCEQPFSSVRARVLLALVVEHGL